MPLPRIRRSSPADLVAVALALAVLAGALGGCGRYYWGKPGATEAQFAQDHRACSAAGVPSARPGEYKVFDAYAYRTCLAGRGWVREQKVDPPAGWYRGFE